MKKILISLMLMAMTTFTATAQDDIQTHTQYLSGRGCDDMVQWDFKCTDGQNSGRWTKIGVPSCWELQGFGTYQYGMRFYGKATPAGIADEKGLYKYEFTLPKTWEGKQIELVFEAVMTDARVTINGRKGGSHQGGFCRFRLDVSDRVFFGNKKNTLEVEVAKESSDPQVNMAERRADYWNFGGIFRPVFVVAKPAENISRVAIDARGDGHFMCDAFLNRAVAGSTVITEIRDMRGKTIATNTTDTRSSDIAHIDFLVNNPRQWTAETPNRYEAVFFLKDAKGKTLHEEHQKFGFRTIEYRQSDGVYINGNKVIFKGVNRHSFRPESGRTLSKALNIEDVETIKAMNMNAVRLSHYPADPEFLDACDSLGLYVENELPGWHWAHGTVTGQKLVKEMVTRDVNHPSVIFWSNGNEGGFNYELEPDFAKWDIQKRVVLYPWANRNGFETKHYRSWGETQEFMRQKEIFMPTEFLHGLYDGGHGAGLKDYWDMMMKNPRCAGGFLWDYSDEGVVRTDKNGYVDCMGNFGADGIVGPHLEREGSFYTIKEVWSPVELVATAGKREVLLINHYDYLNLNTVKFEVKYLDLPSFWGGNVKTIATQIIKNVSAEPGQKATLMLNDNALKADAVSITAKDYRDKDIFTWVIDECKNTPLHEPSSAKVEEKGEELTVKAMGKIYVFSNQTGRLKHVLNGDRMVSFGNGPRFFAIRRADRSLDQYYNHDDKEVEDKKTQYLTYDDQGKFAGFDVRDSSGVTIVTARYDYGTLNEVRWTFNTDATVTMDYRYDFGGVADQMGIIFDYPETNVEAKSWVGNGPYRVWQNRMQGPQYGYWHNKYNDPIPGESWEYPEFKGYFSNVEWMQFDTKEGKFGMETPKDKFVGVYTPRDGRDHILYELPESGISILDVIPAVRNKVNSTDLNGPSARPYWSMSEKRGKVTFKF
jgi:hypothetical protein